MITLHCRLVALPRPENRVFLAWRLPAELPRNTAFIVHRAAPAGPWREVSGPLSEGTCFEDTPPAAGAYRYRVSVAGEPDRISETCTVDTARQAPANVWFRAPLPVPAAQCRHCVAADIDNDGRMDFVVRYFDGDTVRLSGIRGDGRRLWSIDTALPARGGWDLSANHVPFLCWDIDHDGRTEVVYHGGGRAWCNEQSGYYDCARPEGEMLVIADAETGETKRTCPWPAEKPRVMMTLGYLRGREASPHVVVLDETYGGELITAIEGATGRVYWQHRQERPAGHNLDIADIDCDGVQEVIAGGTCYRGNGDILWNAEPFGHTDMSKPANVDPERPGLEIWYLVESHSPGVYLVDSGGRTIFKEPFDHAHFGWIAKHTAEYPGLQLHAAEDRRSHTNHVHHPVFLHDGRHWAELTNEQSRDLMPVQWDAGEETVFIHRRNHEIVRYKPDGSLEPVPLGTLPPHGLWERNIVCADIVGDYREDIVTVDSHSNELIGITNTALNPARKLSPMESFSYRHDRSQHGSGYYLYVAPHD